MNSFDKATITIVGFICFTLINVVAIFCIHNQRVEQTKAQVEIVRMQHLCLDS